MTQRSASAAGHAALKVMWSQFTRSTRPCVLEHADANRCHAFLQHSSQSHPAFWQRRMCTSTKFGQNTCRRQKPRIGGIRRQPCSWRLHPQTDPLAVNHPQTCQNRRNRQTRRNRKKHVFRTPPPKRVPPYQRLINFPSRPKRNDRTGHKLTFSYRAVVCIFFSTFSPFGRKK